MTVKGKPSEQWIKRLNILLRFANPKKTDLRIINNGEFYKLVDDLYLAVIGLEPTPNAMLHSEFVELATRPAVTKAQEGLKSAFEVDFDKEGKVTFQLAPQELQIFYDDDFGYYLRYWSKDFSTVIHHSLGWVAYQSEIKRVDLRVCPNDKCEVSFYPLRKPRKGARSFCSQQCRTRVAAMEYRQENADELKEKERSRSEKRYAAKIAAKFPKAKVKVKKKKPK
jgi:hypothetical protein